MNLESDRKSNSLLAGGDQSEREVKGGLIHAEERHINCESYAYRNENYDPDSWNGVPVSFSSCPVLL